MNNKIRMATICVAMLFILSIIVWADTGGGSGKYALNPTTTDNVVNPPNKPVTNPTSSYGWFTSVTSGNEYTITTYGELVELSDVVSKVVTYPNGSVIPNTPYDFSGKTIRLATNLSLSPSSNWKPIGTDSNPFRGNFDGRNFTVSNLQVNSNSLSSVGLFGTIANGTVSNLKIQNAQIAGTNQVGTLAGAASNSQISAVFVTASTVKGTTGVGGLVGVQSGTVMNSSAFATVSGTEQIGGLLGYNTGIVKNSSSNGNVAGCSKVGGLIGQNYSASAQITASNSSASVSAIGSSTSDFGGFIGLNSGGVIYQSFANGVVSGNNSVGGFVGSNLWGSTTTSISNCNATGNVTGNSSVGGFVGNNEAEIISCTAKGSVTASGMQSGGFAGRSYGAIITSLATGAVSGQQMVGGLIGELSSNNLALSQSFAMGNVTGSSEVGGLVGNNKANINSCYATGTVYGSSAVGGLIGANQGSLNETYATGYVVGTYGTGGLVGSVYTGSQISASNYYSRQTSGRYDTGKGSGILSKAFVSVLPNGFGGNWIAQQGHYPQLRVFHSSSGYDVAACVVSTSSIVPIKDSDTLQNISSNVILTPSSSVIWSSSNSQVLGIDGIRRGNGSTNLTAEASYGGETVGKTVVVYTSNSPVPPTPVPPTPIPPTPIPTPPPVANPIVPPYAVYWAGIEKMVTNIPTGTTQRISIEPYTTVPTNIFSLISGRNVNIAFQGNNYTWYVNGLNVTSKNNTGSYDLGVTGQNSADIARLCNNSDVTQINIAHDGALPATMMLSINAGNQYVGSTLHLNYYDPNNKNLVEQATAKVDAYGRISFPFKHASVYAITTIKVAPTSSQASSTASSSASSKPTTSTSAVSQAVSSSSQVSVNSSSAAPVDEQSVENLQNTEASTQPSGSQLSQGSSNTIRGEVVTNSSNADTDYTVQYWLIGLLAAIAISLIIVVFVFCIKSNTI